MTTQSDNITQSQPWYRYPMVWMVIGLPLIVVVASIYTMIIAHNNAPIIIPGVNQGAAVIESESD